MTVRKPKPRKAAVRKGSGPTLAQRVSDLERLADWNSDCITVLHNELEALQTRKQFRDASHDEPVSNAGEAVGQHFRIIGEVPRTPIFDWIKDPPAIESPRAPWWQFWRRW